MRTPFVAGNWKMNKTVAESRELVSVMGKELKNINGVEKVLCPPFISLVSVANLLGGTDIGLCAQNMFWEDKGAYTGETSPVMVKEFCNYVILGHSERRTYFGETNETINKKVHAAKKHELIPIVCVGETLSENEAGKTAEVVKKQTIECLDGFNASDPFSRKIVIAYEPVWAIGTGRASSSDNAQSVHYDVIRKTLIDLLGEETANMIRILYGGSVTAANAEEFFSMPDIDGALVGGASLKSDEFIAICRAAKTRTRA